MIRNIVFDMGKVLVDYSGMPVCRHFTDNEALAKRICTAVFDSPEWVLLDMGVIKEKDGIEKMISRLDTEEEKEEIYEQIAKVFIRMAQKDLKRNENKQKR